MPFPQYPKKYDQEVIITPRQHLAAEEEADFYSPKLVILCFETYVMDHFKKRENTEHRTYWTGEIIYLLEHEREIALVGNFGIGGPAASHILEILIAAGTEKFIVVGHAGGLQPSNPIATIVLTDKAIRDEGVSHHYLPPQKYTYPSPELSIQLQALMGQQAISYKIGGSWTIDSMYRETKDEIKHYAKEGIATVEMELASLFAVASFRHVHLAALLVISDYVAFEEWDEYFHSEATSQALFQAIEIARQIA